MSWYRCSDGRASGGRRLVCPHGKSRKNIYFSSMTIEFWHGPRTTLHLFRFGPLLISLLPWFFRLRPHRPSGFTFFLVCNSLQGSLRLFIRKLRKVKVSWGHFKKPIERVSQPVMTTRELGRTYHSGRISVTVRMRGIVVSTKSWKITHSGCLYRPQDECRATTLTHQALSVDYQGSEKKRYSTPDCPLLYGSGPCLPCVQLA